MTDKILVLGRREIDVGHSNWHWECVGCTQLCALNATDNMLCEMPVLNLPSDLTSSNDTRREGLAVATLRTANEIANLYIGYVLDDMPTFRNISKSRPHINFSLTQLEVSFPPPPDKPISFDPSVSKFLHIKVRVDDSTRCITVVSYHGTAVERRSVTGQLSLSCARPAADWWTHVGKSSAAGQPTRPT